MNEHIIDIPKEKTFDLPAGTFKATLVSITDKQRFSGDKQIAQVRLLFEVEVPSIKYKQPMAGKTFDIDLRRGSELAQFLRAWKGAEWMERISGQKFDLNMLIGEEVELELIHRKTTSHMKPLVLIQNIRPLPAIKLRELKQAA